MERGNCGNVSTRGRTRGRTRPNPDRMPRHCTHCDRENRLGYLRLLDMAFEGMWRDSSAVGLVFGGIFGRAALKTYGGEALYFGLWNDGGERFDVLACGNCWQTFLNCRDD